MIGRVAVPYETVRVPTTGSGEQTFPHETTLRQGGTRDASILVQMLGFYFYLKSEAQM